MAIKTNSSDEKFFKEFSLYTGVTKMKVLAINPNLEELQELGFNFQQEPEYAGQTDEGADKVRLDFILGNEFTKAKVSFFLQNTPSKGSTSGKFEFINNFCKSSWGTSLEEVLQREGKGGMKFFKPNGARVALVGEVSLMAFLCDWLNTSPEDEVTLDTLKKIIKGDVKELKEYLNAAKNNEVYVLITATENNDKYYQNVENRFFVRSQFSETTAINKFSEWIKKQPEKYKPKGVYNINFGKFEIPKNTISPDKEVLPETSTKEEDVPY